MPKHCFRNLMSKHSSDHHVINNWKRQRSKQLSWLLDVFFVDVGEACSVRVVCYAFLFWGVERQVLEDVSVIMEFSLR